MLYYVMLIDWLCMLIVFVLHDSVHILDLYGFLEVDKYEWMND
jgi:hypothetical protein